MICDIHGLLQDDLIYTDQVKQEVYKKTEYIKRCQKCATDKTDKDFYFCHKHGWISTNLLKKNNNSYICRICHRESAARKRNENREAYNEKIAEDKIKNPGKYKKLYQKHYKRLKERFGDYHSLNKQCRSRGITLEEYAELLDKQDNKCAICNQCETCKDPRHDRVRRLSIDHCHVTNKVRGLLCHSCNTAIGKLKDDTVLLEKAIAYIKKHRDG